MNEWSLDLGANLLRNGKCHFKVWAPHQSSVQVHIHKPGFSPQAMMPGEKGYFELDIRGLNENDLYTYILSDGVERSDPVSRFLPHGSIGPSAIINSTFPWSDQNWKGLPQEDLIFYECHVGTFTPAGTLQGVQEKLPYLKDLGITCLELMPIGQFAGKFGWGYDPQNPYAVHNSYGHPQNLKELVDACHALEIAVCLDVVYNHFGPEGCYFGDFGPYWTDCYQTPWGKGINYDGAFSDEVRNYFLQNALYWITEYHVDALRLDALHALFDKSASPFLQQLSSAAEEIGVQQNRKIALIAESNLNDSRLIRPLAKDGMGLNAFWDEDFHHAWHVSITKETSGYYCDFHGLPDLKKAMNKGVVYEGKYSEFRHFSHGNSFRGIVPKQFVSFIQNHDQIGNRPIGDRISQTLSFDAEKMSALFLLLSPYLPLLFMGQEYGEKAPFQYFVDYENPELMTSIIENRKKEFSLDDLPVPDKSAFLLSKLNWQDHEPKQKVLLDLYKNLIRIRKKTPFFHSLQRKNIKVFASRQIWLAWEYPELACCCNFTKNIQEIDVPFKDKFTLLLHTDQKKFLGKESLVFDAKKLTLPPECGAVFQSASI